MAENSRLKVQNYQLHHEIAALKIALQGKELENSNIVRIYEDLLTDLLPSIPSHHPHLVPNPEDWHSISSWSDLSQMDAQNIPAFDEQEFKDTISRINRGNKGMEVEFGKNGEEKISEAK